MAELIFFSTDLYGITLPNPDESARRSILESVETELDADYPDVYLSLRNGISIGYRSGGYLFWEEDGEVTRYCTNVSVDEAMVAWTQLASNDRDALDRLPWQEINE